MAHGDDEGHLKADAVGAAVGSLSVHAIPTPQHYNDPVLWASKFLP